MLEHSERGDPASGHDSGKGGNEIAPQSHPGLDEEENGREQADRIGCEEEIVGIARQMINQRFLAAGKAQGAARGTGVAVTAILAMLLAVPAALILPCAAWALPKRPMQQHSTG